MLTHKGRFDPTRFEDLTVTVDFHCHSACRFCIVQEGMNLFKGVSEDKLRAAVADNARSKRYRRICFTGGEVTLEKKLFDYVAIARESKSFELLVLSFVLISASKVPCDIASGTSGQAVTLAMPPK